MTRPTQFASTAQRICADIDGGFAVLDTGRDDDPISALVLLLLKCERYPNVPRSLRKYRVQALNDVELAESCMRHDLTPQDYLGYRVLGAAPFFTGADRAWLQTSLAGLD